MLKKFNHCTLGLNQIKNFLLIIFKEYVEQKAVECSYKSIFQMLFGRKLLSNAHCQQYERAKKTALDPKIVDCKFKHTCDINRSVDVKIRHCGSFYVYNLHSGSKFNTDLGNFYRIPRLTKKGLYCGTKNQTLPKPKGKFCIYE